MNNNNHRGQNNGSPAGSKGIPSSSSSGNFKNDPQRASEAGQKGGKAAHSGKSSTKPGSR